MNAEVPAPGRSHTGALNVDGSDMCADRPDSIRVRGARSNNLRGVDVDLPHDQLTVITGPSGSGKSSLAFDTLYAEGQRQYIESLSLQARQFLHQVARPDVDLVEGLPPTLCIDQRTGSRHPRSTVATITEVYDYLRLLMARLGQAVCHQCGRGVGHQSQAEILRRLDSLPQGTKAMIMAPLVRGQKGKHAETFARIRKWGFVRVRVDGLVCELDAVPELVAQKPHDIDAVVDRIVLRPEVTSRRNQSVALALEHGSGALTVCHQPGDGSSDWQDLRFNTLSTCADCEISFDPLEPRSFSFNSPYGACPTCEGIGRRERFDPELLFPQRDMSWDGDSPAKRQLTEKQRNKLEEAVAPFFAREEVATTTLFCDYRAETWQTFLHGDGQNFLGILILLEQEFATSQAPRRLAALEKLRAQVVCPDCDGTRLKLASQHVRFADRSMAEIVKLSLVDALDWFASIQLQPAEVPIGQPLLEAIRERLTFLVRVGVGYLTLGRGADSLSGGEFQRVRLATSLGSGLIGVCYILDEPSIGLHPRDNQRLIATLQDLRDSGNTVVVVEHDASIMTVADLLVDMGPSAGNEGGRVVAVGTPAEVAANPASLTGQYLSGKARVPQPAERRLPAKTRSLLLRGVTTNNLTNIDVRFPLGVLLGITGVSGSGKSSLVNGTLAPALMRRLGTGLELPGPHAGLQGVSHLDKVIRIDQKPIGRSPRSNPATYTGIFDEIRKVFAGTRASKQWGFTASRFSFNNRDGRCATCRGAGLQKIEMSYLPDLDVPCPDCDGARFNRQTLAVEYREHSIADVLELSIAEAKTFFENFASIARYLDCLDQVGLGYLRLGQASTTLSGGEAQRIKLATELARVSTGKTLYLLDEPTTGLHVDDIRRLISVLQGLVDQGNSVFVIEHNLDVVRCADWIIDLGPEGGQAGGRVVAEGTPEDIANVAASHTGQALREALRS